MTRRDARVAAMGGAQHTIVTHEQLIELGCSRSSIAHWVNSGRLRVEFQGVYSLVGGGLPPLAREQAALLACGERAFLSHQTAGFIWGLRKAPQAEVEVSVVGRYRRSSKGIKVHRLRAVDRSEVRRHEGLWVSSPARAVLELAGTLSPDELAAAIDEGLARRVLRRGEVEAVLARNRPCRGSARLADVLGAGAGTTISRSRAERAFLKLVRDARLPAPEANVPFGRWEVDFMWRRERLAVEIDGYLFHSGPKAFHRDREKDLALQDAGFVVLRFTRDHVIHEGTLVVARVAATLARLAAAA